MKRTRWILFGAVLAAAIASALDYGTFCRNRASECYDGAVVANTKPLLWYSFDKGTFEGAPVNSFVNRGTDRESFVEVYTMNDEGTAVVRRVSGPVGGAVELRGMTFPPAAQDFGAYLCIYGTSTYQGNPNPWGGTAITNYTLSLWVDFKEVFYAGCPANGAEITITDREWIWMNYNYVYFTPANYLNWFWAANLDAAFTDYNKTSDVFFTFTQYVDPDNPTLLAYDIYTNGVLAATSGGGVYILSDGFMLVPKYFVVNLLWPGLYGLRPDGGSVPVDEFIFHERRLTDAEIRDIANYVLRRK